MVGQNWRATRESHPRQESEHLAVTNQPESSKAETAAVATGNFLDQMEQILGSFEEKVQSVSDAINIMDAKNFDHVESIDKRYDENDNDKLDEDEMQ